MEHDCSIAEDDRPLRQGDIFAWSDRARTRPWRTFGIVITADCDLAQSKTHGKLSYLPILTLEDYLWTFWRVEKFSLVLDRFQRKAIDRLNKILLRLNPDRKPLSQEAALAWIARTESETLAVQAGLEDAGQKRDFCTILDNYRLIERLLKTIEPDVTLLNSAHALARGASPSSDFGDLAKDVQSSISSLPGDVFFVSGIEGFETFGMLVMLRHITQCSINDIATKPEDLRWGTASARRIARVNAPYKFALAQNMARVFIDIGLPSEYSERQKTSSSKYFKSLVTS